MVRYKRERERQTDRQAETEREGEKYMLYRFEKDTKGHGRNEKERAL